MAVITKRRRKLERHKITPPQETKSAVEKPVKINADFDKAIEALLSVPIRKPKRRRRYRRRSLVGRT